MCRNSAKLDILSSLVSGIVVFDGSSATSLGDYPGFFEADELSLGLFFVETELLGIGFFGHGSIEAYPIEAF